MSLYGGSVTAGSIVAILQSIGAAGLGGLGNTIVGILGGIAGNEAAARYFRNANEEERKGFTVGLTACMMSPYGGNLSPERAVSVLKELESGGLDAIRNAEDKARVVLCLVKIASSHKM